MKVTLKTTTPVHIGTGLSYFPNEYVTSSNKSGINYISRIDQGKFGAVLTESQRDSFVEQLDENFRMTRFCKENNLVPKDLRRYIVENRSGEHDPKEIREGIKTGGLPYIPGSSLKGAIRTALLWWHTRNDSRYIDIIGRELDYDRFGKKKRNIGSEFVNRIFSCNDPERKYDPKYDLLRFLQVSDCMPVENKTSIESISTFSLQINGKMIPKSFRIYAECMNGSFSGSIGGLDQIKEVISHRDYPMLKNKISLLGMNDPSDLDAVPGHLMKVVSEWSRWCFSKELALAESDDEISSMLSPVRSWISDSPHIRVGFGVGTLYQTMIALVEEQDPDLAVNLIDKYRLARRHTHTIEYGSIDPLYPKTLELTANDEPLGWLSFSLESG